MDVGTTFDLVVHEKHLDTGTHEYMVWYDAKCTVISHASSPPVWIDVKCELPEFARLPHQNGDSQSMLECALENIEKGVVAALLHRDCGLQLNIVALTLHPVDFQPFPFMLHTYYYMRRQLELMDS